MFNRSAAIAGLAAVTFLGALLLGGCPQPIDTGNNNGNNDPGLNDQSGGNQDQSPGDNSGNNEAKGNEPDDNNGGNNGGNNDNNNGGNNNGGNPPDPNMPTEPPPGWTWDDLWALLAVYEQTGEFKWDLNSDGVVNQVDLGILIYLLMTQS